MYLVLDTLYRVILLQWSQRRGLAPPQGLQHKSEVSLDDYCSWKEEQKSSVTQIYIQLLESFLNLCFFENYWVFPLWASNNYLNETI